MRFAPDRPRRRDDDQPAPIPWWRHGGVWAFLGVVCGFVVGWALAR